MTESSTPRTTTDGPKCETCGLEITTGMMAAFCSKGRACEFWPHSDGDPELVGGELLMYRFWMDNTLEQIGLQIEDRKRLAAEIESQKRALSDSPKIACWISVGDRLPDDGQVVLCYWPTEPPCMQSLTYLASDSDVDGRDAWRDIFDNDEDGPTHWMPLPEAPK